MNLVRRCDELKHQLAQAERQKELVANGCSEAYMALKYIEITLADAFLDAEDGPYYSPFLLITWQDEKSTKILAYSSGKINVLQL